MIKKSTYWKYNKIWIIYEHWENNLWAEFFMTIYELILMTWSVSSAPQKLCYRFQEQMQSCNAIDRFFLSSSQQLARQSAVSSSFIFPIYFPFLKKKIYFLINEMLSDSDYYTLSFSLLYLSSTRKHLTCTVKEVGAIVQTRERIIFLLTLKSSLWSLSSILAA